MIEVIGVRELEEQKPEWRELPKNLRQVGENSRKRKIYMEDYVVTYLGKLAKPSQAYARGAILFGKNYETEEGPAIFINGAVEAQNLELDMDETIFNDKIWEEILQMGEQYFPGQQIVGWFLSRIGFSVEMNQKIIHTHLKNFPGDQKVLYMIDGLENEDAIYLCENQQMKRQKGYYIYYEKNSAMQEYMIAAEGSRIGEAQEQEERKELRRDRKVVNGYRRMSRYNQEMKKQNRKIHVVRAACLFLIFVMGISILGQAKKRWGGSEAELYVAETFRAIQNVFGTEKQNFVQEEVLIGENKSADGETSEENKAGKKENPSVTVGPPALDAKTQDTSQGEETMAQPFYYTVRKGDTLAKISRKMYATDKYTKQIAWANDLSDANEIYVGQQLLIPSIGQ